MDNSERIQRLIDVALDSFDGPEVSVSSSLRRASRIAALRTDLVNQLWTLYELVDMTNSIAFGSQDPATARIRESLVTLLGPDEGQAQARKAYDTWERNRYTKMDGDDEKKLFAPPIGQVEHELVVARGIYDSPETPEHGKAQILSNLHEFSTILERVRTSTHDFLVATEAELNAGQTESALFLRAQEYIDAALTRIAPEALEKFVAARDRLYSGKPEDLAHALTSCRRMIKALADALYPATGETVVGDDGVSRVMSDDAYRNRLVQYAKLNSGSTQGSALAAAIDNLSARLKSLDSLASKGVHDDVSVREAETCVMLTYLLAGDLVRIADGESSGSTQQ